MDAIFPNFVVNMRRIFKDIYLFISGRAEEIPKMDDEELRLFDERVKRNCKSEV